MIDPNPKRTRFTPAEWIELDRLFDAWSMDQTRAHGAFFQRDAQAVLGISPTPFKRLFHPYLQDGRAHALGHLKGYARTGTASVVTLQDLMDLAEANIDVGYRPPRGRPSTQRDRRVERINGAQFDDMRTVANLAAEEITGDPGNWSGVGASWFGWDPAAGDGAAGAWEIAKHIERWVHSRARAKAMAAGKPWNPSRSESTVRKYCSIIGTLLNLAATKGVLQETARHSAAYNVHAAEWEPHIRYWTEKLAARSKAAPGTTRKIRQGLRTLALYATRAGSTEPRATDWGAIRDAVMADYGRGAITYDVMNWARWIYREIHGRMIKRSSGSGWPLLQSTRTTLVPSAAITAVSNGDDAWSEWDAPGLTVGTFGLSRWLAWATATNSGALKAAKLPPRRWPRPTAEERRRLKKKPSLFKLTRGVARDRLAQFALLAGYLKRDHGIDWAVADATVLVDPDTAHGFVTWCAARMGNDDGTTSLGSAVLFSLATLASPYLEAVAIEQNDLMLADLMRAHSDSLKEHAIEAAAEELKRIQFIATLWDAGRTGKPSGGWFRLLELRDLLIKEAEAAAGDRGVAEQIQLIRKGTFSPSKPEAWAVAVRAAVLITLLRRIPLRGRSTCELTDGMWENVAPQLPGDGSPRPWGGAIRIALPKEATKPKRPFAPWLIRQEHVGNPHHEALLRRDVLEVYWMDGGARDRILTIAGQPQTSCYVFPAVASRGGGHGITQDSRGKRQYRWDVGSLSSHFSALVLDHATQLGMDRQALEDTWGATSIHVIRLLYGTKWAPERLLEASRMLQHAAVHITERRYCALTAEDVHLDVEPEDLVPQKSPRELELERRIRELEARLVASARAA